MVGTVHERVNEWVHERVNEWVHECGGGLVMHAFVRWYILDSKLGL